MHNILLRYLFEVVFKNLLSKYIQIYISLIQLISKQFFIFIVIFLAILFLYFIGNRARDTTVFISKNDSLATINVPILEEYKHDINILISENEECISDSILNEFNNLNLNAATMYVAITVLMVRNPPSKGEDDENPETSEFFILLTSALYTEDEIPEFLDHIKPTVNSRIENTQNQLQGSVWVIREIVKFEMSICKFIKGVLGHYKLSPQGLRGSHNIFNPRSSENCFKFFN